MYFHFFLYSIKWRKHRSIKTKRLNSKIETHISVPSVTTYTQAKGGGEMGPSQRDAKNRARWQIRNETEILKYTEKWHIDIDIDCMTEIIQKRLLLECKI